MRYRFKPKTITLLSITVSLLSLLFAVGVWAATGGSTDSSAAPNATNSYTLADIYARLTTGTAGSQSAFTEPAGAPLRIVVILLRQCEILLQTVQTMQR